jgi:hypothetical protein
MTHEKSSRPFESRNSSAEANVCVILPSDLTRLSVVTRTDPSSSMIATSGSFDKAIDLSLTRRLPPRGVRRPDIRSHHGFGLKRIPGYKDLAFLVADSELVSHCDQFDHRPSLHLSHHMAPMDLHGNLGDPQFCRDLLVHQTIEHERNHFPLA